ncbi:hypothetical protein LB518_22805 [Mesorhizobium sp. BR1-1-16]|uniref:structural cement protein Gp24 n=1 Tax=Mesorhizobium sp. BR1-1-16 TaxID=2876653 RepID=UPI001CCBEB62|nr:hypothetical protein [Mesorhizobium sp. BR1-1-16]MBZ9939145.1 hypothetical protein [Mesorhizobium sp. BR1-1-16]
MVAYATRVPAGFPGTVSRSDSLTITQEIIDSGTPPTAFGKPVKMVSGKVQPVASGDAGSVTYGWAVKPFPAQSSTNTLGGATPPTSGILDVLRRGYIAAALTLGTAAKNGQVYVVTTAGGTVVVGDVVTAASPAGGGTGVAVTGSFFTGPADANGVVEIAHNI